MVKQLPLTNIEADTCVYPVPATGVLLKACVLIGQWRVDEPQQREFCASSGGQVLPNVAWAIGPTDISKSIAELSTVTHKRPGISICLAKLRLFLGDVESYTAMAIWVCTGESLCQDQIKPAWDLSGKVAAGFQTVAYFLQSSNLTGLLSLRLYMQPSENYTQCHTQNTLGRRGTFPSVYADE